MQKLLVALFLLAGFGEAEARPARTESGAVASERVDGVDVYRAIPFAAAPVGPLRWRAPQPAPRWSGVRQSSAFAPSCMQEGVSMAGETPRPVSEDCLYLNVWAPAGRRDVSAPVMVWIHGGGFANGSAAMPLYSGEQFARRGVVFVTVAYRLGPLGFLAHPELSAESADRSSGNYGLLDQLAALTWVQRNIAAFGGDPRRVTVLGQSAGATSVSLLMASPQARGLFQRAVAQSGGVFEPLALAPGWKLENAEKTGVAYATSLGAASIEDLRKLPASRLLQGQAKAVSHPVIGGGAFPLSPYDAYIQGKQIDVPILIGSNAEEARSLIDLSRVTAARYGEDIRKAWGSLPEALYQSYPHDTDALARDARAHFERDLRFGWDVWAWARLQRQAQRSPAYYYHFSQSPPFPADSVHAGWGPSHFAELWYVFDHLDQTQWSWTANDRRLANRMTRYWINFATSGNPNAAGLPTWPAFSAEDQVLHLGEDVSVGRVAGRGGLESFDRTYDQVRGATFGAK